MTARYHPGRARRPIRRSKESSQRQPSAAAEPSEPVQAIDETAASVPKTAEPRAAASERPVTRMARALAVVPSTGPSRKAWAKLGFSVDEPTEFMGCAAFDVVLIGCGLRFLVAPREHTPNPLTAAISELLEKGTGLLGWSWACQSVHNSRDIIEQRSGVAFAAAPGGGKTAVVPRGLTPGATTVLEPLASQELRVHANHSFALDHVVVTVSDVDAAADIYERAFALKARRTDLDGKRYAFLKVGEVNGSVIEIAGPSRPQSGALTGHGWGLAFRTGDLGATLRYLRKAGVSATEPHEAAQGGRIASITMQLGGISIAFLEN